MSNPTPFIPAKLDDAELSPHEFRVFCHVSRRGDCTASIGHMSSTTGVSEPTLRGALKTLRHANMIATEKRPGTTNIQRTRSPSEWTLDRLGEPKNDQEESGTPSQDIGDPKKLPLQNLGDHPSKILGGHPSKKLGGASKGNPFEGNPLEGAKEVSAADAPLPRAWRELVDRISWTAKPLPDDHPARWEYQPEDWRWIAADWSLSQLQDRDMLNSHYRKRLEDERRGKIASEWADVIRKIVDLDGYTKQEVRITLAWLFEVENWWRENRTIQSLGALRKKGKDGSTKFDKILQSALADYEQQQQKRTDPEEIREGFEGGEGRDAAEPSGDSVPSEPEVDEAGFHW